MLAQPHVKFGMAHDRNTKKIKYHCERSHLGHHIHPIIQYSIRSSAPALQCASWRKICYTESRNLQQCLKSWRTVL